MKTKSKKILELRSFLKLKENSFKKRKWVERSIFLIALSFLITLLLRKCDQVDKLNQNIRSKIESEIRLNNQISDLINRKAILIVKDTIINGSSGKFVSAMVVSNKDSGISNVFIKEKIKRVPYKVLIESKCPEQECPDKTKVLLEVNKELNNLLIECDELMSNSLTTCLYKRFKQDSINILLEKSLSIKDLLFLDSQINYSNKYIEYLKEGYSYRKKTQNSFKRAVVSGTFSVGLYAISESLGHPKYYDNQKNSKAEKLSNQIFWLRAGSLVAGLYSLFESGRTIYFHNKEAKFIVNPTEIGLVIYLDSE